MSKSIAFKEPTVKPTPDAWVQTRAVEPAPEPSTPLGAATTATLPVVHSPLINAPVPRATRRQTIEIDEEIHVRLKILCARRRLQIGDFLAKVVTDAVAQAEQELQRAEQAA